MNAPKLTKFNIDKYTKWVDSIVKLDLPDSANESILSELVKTYQIHHYLTTFRNYKNEKCRFHFGKFFTTITIIVEPLANFVPGDIKRAKMQYRKTILKKVKNYIGNELNPSKENFVDKTKDEYVELKSIEGIFKGL